jgi:osmotically inducible lipoprotein OsmB
MKLQRNIARITAIGLVSLAMAGCATHNRKSNNTLLGAGLGAATGAVFSGGDPLYTLGGAAAGGVLGNVLTEDRSERRGRSWKGNKRSSRQHSHDRRRR